MENVINKKQKYNFIKTIVVTVLVINSWLPSAKAITGQDIAIKMGLSIAGSITGKAVTSAIFPNKGIDYVKIREIMQEVTRKLIIEAEVSGVEGELRPLNTYVYSSIFAKGLPPGKRHDKLMDYALQIGRLVDRLNGEFYARESLATYVAGAQAELAALAAAYRFAIEAKDTGGMDEAMITFKDRLFIHYEQMEYLPIVQSEIRIRRLQRSNCKRYGNVFKGFKWWLQDSDWTGRRLVRNWYRGPNKCWAALNQYRNKAFRDYVLDLNKTENFGWMQQIAQTWFKIGLDLKIFTSRDRIKDIVNTYTPY